MKRLFKYIFLLPLLLLVSCVYDEGLSIEDVLKVSDNTFEFTAAGDEIEFTIESYCGWLIKCEADWVSFSDYVGESKVVKNVLTVSENLSVNARTVQAEIVNDRYGINIKLNISQEAGVPYIKTSSERLEFEEEGGVAEIKVESNISWEASADVDWISISPKSGVSGVTTMTIDVNKNTSVSSRSVVIRIVNSEYEIEEKKLVVQSEFVPELKVNVEKLENISYNGSTEEIRIESNIYWEASVDVDWIGISPKSGLSGVTTMTIDVNKNTSVASRSAVIRIVNSEYEIEEEILVSQSEWVPELKVNVEKIENISYNGSIEEIKIESSISWNAWVDVDWIEISPKSGESGVCTMTIVVGENVLEESRDGVITLKNQEYSLTTEVIIQQLSHTINGHEYVDLGLPSGLKWATCNVGAENPEDYGNYYAWGETSTKSEITEENSLTYGKSMSDISGNITYDVARKEWGSSWRLPTKKELEELESKCKWQWTTINGKNGYKVTGPNGNSIFLPAAGCRYGSSLDYAGEYGYFWSSAPLESNDDSAYYLYFNSSHRNVDWCYRYFGQSVRPVSE